MPEDFKVRVGNFEGPLELLLDLIEKRKLHISDVSLSQVADEFVEHIKSFEEFPVRDSADFILVASTLLLIKSKSLLPNLQMTEEEQTSIEELENRLNVYRKYKELSENLKGLFGNFVYFAKEKKREKVLFIPAPEINLESLKVALQGTIENMPTSGEELPKVAVSKVISLEEMINRLSERIRSSLKTSFKEFSGNNKAKKIEVIVSFLAILELVKRGTIRVNQEKHFEDIEIESEKTGVPAYY